MLFNVNQSPDVLPCAAAAMPIKSFCCMMLIDYITSFCLATSIAIQLTHQQAVTRILHTNEGRVRYNIYITNTRIRWHKVPMLLSAEFNYVHCIFQLCKESKYITTTQVVYTDRLTGNCHAIIARKCRIHITASGFTALLYIE